MQQNTEWKTKESSHKEVSENNNEDDLSSSSYTLNSFYRPLYANGFNYRGTTFYPLNYNSSLIYPPAVINHPQTLMYYNIPSQDTSAVYSCQPQCFLGANSDQGLYYGYAAGCPDANNGKQTPGDASSLDQSLARMSIGSSTLLLQSPFNPYLTNPVFLSNANTGDNLSYLRSPTISLPVMSTPPFTTLASAYAKPAPSSLSSSNGVTTNNSTPETSNSQVATSAAKQNGHKAPIVPKSDAHYFVMKSYSEDDILISIKHGIWCSTERGNKRLDQVFRENFPSPIYLIFSVNGSGKFCGIAQMFSPVDHDKQSGVWSQSKWRGEFQCRWVLIKDVPNALVRHIRIESNENRPVTNSRDATELPPDKGAQLLDIMWNYVQSSTLISRLVPLPLESNPNGLNASSPVILQKNHRPGK